VQWQSHTLSGTISAAKVMKPQWQRPSTFMPLSHVRDNRTPNPNSCRTWKSVTLIRRKRLYGTR
jgi:hypothetical protein